VDHFNSEVLVYCVLFLCTGNYFRSRFSEIWFNHCIVLLSLQDECIACSAGLNVTPDSGNVGPISVEVLSALRHRGIDVDSVNLPSPRQVDENDLLIADLIVAVDAQVHLPMVRSLFPDWESRIVFWDVKDLGDDQGYVEPVTQLQASVERLIDDLVLWKTTTGVWPSLFKPS